MARRVDVRSKKQLIRMVAKSRRRCFTRLRRQVSAKTGEERSEAKRLAMDALEEFLVRSEALEAYTAE